ncbi:MAG: FAD-dependent oxidoreductase [Actinomycetota bacterium]
MREHEEEHESLEAGGAEPIEDEPVPADIGRVVDEGLGPGRPKRVAVIGAGMAGLASALELKRAGHDVTVLEAQNRVGCRILTCRDFAPACTRSSARCACPDPTTSRSRTATGSAWSCVPS